jgi:hypothetical protein
VWLLGDTLVVSDARHLRLTLFGAEGQVLDTWRGGSSDRRLLPLAPAAGGWFVLPHGYVGWPYRAGVEHRDTSRLTFVRSFPKAAAAFEASSDPTRPTNAEAEEWREILLFAGPRRYGVDTPMSMTATGPLFEPNPSYAVDGLGRIHFTPSDRYVIDSYDAAGRLLRRLTRSHDPVPVTGELVSRYRDRARAYWDTASTGGEAILARGNDEVRPDLPHVPHLPPIGRMFASAEGALWVERIDQSADPLELEWRRPPPPPRATHWDRFDGDGRYNGTATLPPGFSPLAVGEQWVIGVLRDEMGVQYVARLEVEGASGRSP